MRRRLHAGHRSGRQRRTKPHQPEVLPDRPVGTGIAAIVGGMYNAEACLCLAVAAFAWQMAVILTSPAASLAHQPEMVVDLPKT